MHKKISTLLLLVFLVPTLTACGRKTLSQASDPSLGNPNATITITEYAEYPCPFSQKFSQEVLPELKKEYIETGKVRFVFKNYIVQAERSLDAALAAECVYGQLGNKGYFEYQDALFTDENFAISSTERLGAVAEAVGANKLLFAQCMKERRYEDEIKQDTAEGRELGVNGTPTFFVNGEKIAGDKDLAFFEEMLDNKLGL